MPTTIRVKCARCERQFRYTSQDAELHRGIPTVCKGCDSLLSHTRLQFLRVPLPCKYCCHITSTKLCAISGRHAQFAVKDTRCEFALSPWLVVIVMVTLFILIVISRNL